ASTITEAGSFDVTVFPGPHTLMGTAGAGVGYAFIDMQDTDVEGVQIVAMPVFDIPGRLVADGPLDAEDLDSIRISMLREMLVRSTPSSPLARTDAPSYSVPKPDGSFVVDAAAGDYRVNIVPLLNLAPRPPGGPIGRPRPNLQNAYVKAIRL